MSATVEQARSYLAGCLKKGVWACGERLPPIEQIARLAGVSRSTAWKAVQFLKHEKLLTARKGSRILAGSPPEIVAVRQPVSDTLLWQKKRSVLLHDIRNGLYRFGERMPPPGVLQERYGVCYATLRKILQALARDDVLVQYKNGYLVPRPRSQKGRSTIVLLVEEARISAPAGEAVRVHRLVDNLEAECTNHNLGLQLIRYNPGDPDLLTKVRLQLSADGISLGFVIDLWWPFIAEMDRRLLDLLYDLSNRRLPVVIFDEASTIALPVPLAGRPNIRIFRIAGRPAGGAAARLILNAGHRHAAFLSYRHQQSWSVDRLKGVAAQFEKNGDGVTVTPYVLDEVEGSWQLALALFSVSPQTFERIVTPALSREQIDDIVMRFRSVHQNNPLKRCRPAAIASLRSSMQILEVLVRKKIGRVLYTDILNSIYGCAEQHVVEPYLEPLFERTLKDPTITAWIAAEDGTAVAALQFLRRKGIRVPQDVAVMGFENSPEAFRASLTSYDFNMRALAHQMLMVVLFPSRSMSKGLPQIAEIDGYIVERKSTGQNLSRPIERA